MQPHKYRDLVIRAFQGWPRSSNAIARSEFAATRESLTRLFRSVQFDNVQRIAIQNGM
jgi:hypothetical protein